jgi:hypothetical protein
MSAHFDAVKNVYRVYNADGSWNTYTPEQYRALENVAPIVEEEEEGDADIVLEIKDTDVPEEEGDPSIPPSFDAPVDSVPTTGDVLDTTTGDVLDTTTGDVLDTTTGDVIVGQTITGDLNPQN